MSLDGTKIHANASRHSALSYGHAEAIEAQLQSEVQQLLALAEEADGANVPDGMSLPDELKRRADRLAAIAAAKVKIEARAAERYAREQADYQAKLAVRAAKAAAGRKPGGKAPKAPTPGPRPTDQINLTDEESRIMPVAGRWLRARLQRSSVGRHRDGRPGAGLAGRAGGQRQATGGADAREAAGPAGGDQPG